MRNILTLLAGNCLGTVVGSKRNATVRPQLT